MTDKTFICPECGGRRLASAMNVSPSRATSEPWASVFARAECYECKAVIPIALAERWNEISLEEAKSKWRATFRGHAESRVQDKSSTQ